MHTEAAMHPNAELLTRFYTAFQKGDADTMASCYLPDAHFADAVFTDLNGGEIGDMWRMLASRAKNFSLTFDGVSADDKTGKAHWVATYTFSATGNTVVNDIQAAFTFRDGKIATHADSFNLWRWASQALGFKGRLLGWTPLVQGKVRQQAAAGLKQYRAGKKG